MSPWKRLLSGPIPAAMDFQMSIYLGGLVIVALFLIALMRPKPIVGVAGPGQIVLIRHAEKPDDRSDAHLAPEGVARAHQLVTYILTDPTVLRLGRPVALYATQTTKNNRGYRTQETLAPLAAALNLSVQTPFRGKDEAAMAQMVLANPTLAGKTIVIAWNHEQISQLAVALGVTPEPPVWDDRTYDRVYIIAYRGGKPTLTVSRYGDK